MLYSQPGESFYNPGSSFVDDSNPTAQLFNLNSFGQLSYFNDPTILAVADRAPGAVGAFGFSTPAQLAARGQGFAADPVTCVRTVNDLVCTRALAGGGGNILDKYGGYFYLGVNPDFEAYLATLTVKDVVVCS